LQVTNSVCKIDFYQRQKLQIVFLIRIDSKMKRMNIPRFRGDCLNATCFLTKAVARYPKKKKKILKEYVYFYIKVLPNNIYLTIPYLILCRIIYLFDLFSIELSITWSCILGIGGWAHKNSILFDWIMKILFFFEGRLIMKIW